MLGECETMKHYRATALPISLREFASFAERECGWTPSLASIYGVTTGRLNEAVRRNLNRFREDFMLQLTDAEQEILRSQFAISNSGRGGRRYRPFAFTEHGAIQTANVLSSPRAIEMGTSSYEHLCSSANYSRQAQNLRGDWKSSNAGSSRD